MKSFFVLLIVCMLTGCQSWGKFYEVPSTQKNNDLSPDKLITAYSINSLGLTATINGNKISILSPTLTSVGSYIASFTTTGVSITIGNSTQTSGVTSNSFASTLTYTVTAVDGSTQEYYATFTAPKAIGASTLRMWVRADSLGLADGAQVAAWNDDSGSGSNMSQGSAPARPIYRTNVINGKPVCRFTDAANSGMNGATAALTSVDSGTVFIVFAINTNTTARGLITFSGANGREFGPADAPNSFMVQNRNGVGANYVSAFNVPLATFIAFGSVQVAGTSINEIWNGDVKGSNAPSCCSTYVVGGNTSITNSNFEGDIAEIIFYDSALGQVETDKIFCYLNVKYGLTSTRNVCQG